MLDVVQWLLLPIGLGLLGFIEPCSIGSSLMFIKSVEGKNPAEKFAQVGIFMLIRALLMGALGLAAVRIGAGFLGFQKGAWIFFGIIYTVVGIAYLAGKSRFFMVSLGPSLSRFSTLKGSATLGVVFAFNIPACAGPLITVLLGLSAVQGAGGAQLMHGFISMALFGLALSFPIATALFFSRARSALDRLAALSRRVPRWTGALLLILGLWSIWFGLSVSSALKT
jgi:cytochrome c-type biogenesis protein